MSPVRFTFNKPSHSGSGQGYPLQDQADLSRQHEAQSQVPPPHIAEPHVGSFMRESSASESDELTPEEIRKDTDIIYHPDVEVEGHVESEEERRDKSLSIAFTLVGALVIIAGIGFYVKNYIQPSRMDVIPELLINTPDEGENAGNLSPSEEAIRQYRENLDRMNADALRLASSTAQASSTLNAETFAQSRATSTSNNTPLPPNGIVTEYVIKATSTRASTTPRTQSLSELFVSEELGISFKKDPFWKQTTQGDSIILKQVGPEGKDVLFITRFHGGSVTTQDDSYGNVTYFYEAGQKSWMRIDYVGELPSEETIKPEVFVPVRFTKEGKPIFEGTSRAKTLIVALGSDDFVIVNISGTGYTRILDTFITDISINH